MATSTRPYRLEDRYQAREGRILLTAIQALARIPVEQLWRDREAGLNTAAFLSGYPGSPLGGFDLEVARMKRQVPDLPIVHQPAVNEELGAAAVMGSQLTAERPDARYDGVVGIWYGKAPGLDRAGDALRHGVFAGSSSHGGAVVLVGDDPVAKSSTMPSSSDAALVDLHMPVLYPGTIAECLELGLHAVAMSRASGLWSSMKIVTPVADGNGTVDLPVLRQEPIIPTVEIDGKPWREHPNAVFLGQRMVAVEREFREVRLPLAYQYGVDNALNRVSVDPEDAWIGLVSTGFTYYQMLEALRRLGFADEQAIANAGIRVLHLRMPVPFDKALVQHFARGLREVVVIEEKNPTLEWLIKDALYATSERPAVVGKTHEDGQELMPSWGRLDADAIVEGLRERLAPRLADKMKPARTESDTRRAKAGGRRDLIPLAVNRTPFFCSGCPHNWGTKVPEGSLMGSGTGCHGMSMLMDTDRVGETIGGAAMGTEGSQWIGMAPFVETEHILQNFGDGTYFHSGQLALQAAIGAGVSMTFKILYNDTVAMTGGQEPSHRVAVPELAVILLAQGVKRVLITTDDERGYNRSVLPAGVDVWDRRRIIEAQEVLAAIDGVTVLIHDQACAAELRRSRKRGQIKTPKTRVLINHRICEGCGDCGDVSNCLSVEPVDTPLGRKTAIDQASCNFDMSCLDGDCPSFMTVKVSGTQPFTSPEPPELPAPPTKELGDLVTIRMAGIGGTGVVTVAQVLATAAMFDGWDVRGLDQTGLSQKAGPVISDLTLAGSGIGSSNLIGTGEATVILAFDELVAASDGSVAAGAEGHTYVVGSEHRTPTGRMISDTEIAYPTEAVLHERLNARSRGEASTWVDNVALCEQLVGDVAPANVFLLGVAVQEGLIPVAPSSIDQAIELNGVAVAMNLAAFAWGRAWAVHQADTEATGADAARAADPTSVVTVPDLPSDLDTRVAALDEEVRPLVEMRVSDLVAYQNRSYAARYLGTVESVHERDSALHGSFTLTSAVAHNLHRLMAYKDEYEVARLMLLPEARIEAEAIAGQRAKVTWRLHPPVLRAVGMKRKIRFGRWTKPMIRMLRSGRRLRGTSFDPFGRAHVRRLERGLRDEYFMTIETLLSGLTAANYDNAVEIAELPNTVRGYESLKVTRAAEYREHLSTALAEYVCSHNLVGSRQAVWVIHQTVAGGRNDQRRGRPLRRSKAG